MELNLNIDSENYPEIFKLYKKDREKKIKEIFDIGYKINFPNIEDNEKETQYYQILKSISDIKNENTSDLDTKLDDLLSCIQKLTGLSNNSSKKGEIAENLLEEMFNQRYGDITFENKAKIPHSGDAWLYLPDKNIIMLESKNYNYRVNKDELEKMEKDMITNHIKFGIFVSWNSIVQNRKDLDVHTFYHNNETYLIIIISKLTDNISKLDLAVQITRKFVDIFTNVKKFPWIVNDIQDDLTKLDTIIKKNYKLRDNFHIMSNNIRESLYMYYECLRNYQYEISIEIENLINKINSTMSNSVNEIDILKNDLLEKQEYLSLLKKYNTNKKIFTVLTQLIDILLKYECTFTSTEDNDNIDIFNNIKEYVGFIKIQKKKIFITFDKSKISMEFEKTSNFSEIKKILSFIFN